MKQKRRSPITDKPLRSPGQSLQEKRDDLLNDKLLFWLVMCGFLLWFVGYQWWMYYNPRPIHPVSISVIAALFIIYPVFRIWRLWPELRQLKQGIEGEKFVGQFLEGLRGQGYQVFHDLQGDTFNVDHVIIGPAGVFTIETKTLSKPERGQTRIQFDGELVWMNGKPLERNPVIQAKAQASWLRKLLDDLTAKQIKVRPVVVFPGWYIEHSPGALKEIWVLEPKALSKFLENEPNVLAADEVKVLSNQLSRHIRAQEKIAK